MNEQQQQKLDEILKKHQYNSTLVIAIMQDIQRLAPEKMEIICGDALKIDFRDLRAAPRHVISNLPYNVSVPLFLWSQKGSM